MKSRKPILYLALTFALVCIYQLSFTYKIKNLEESAEIYALENFDINKEEELSSLDSLVADSNDRILKKQEIIQRYIDERDIIIENLITEYIDKETILEDGTPRKIFLGMYTYDQCKSREVNLGLDLKGGMNVTLEVSVKDVLIALSGKNKDVKFREALKNAERKLESDQRPFLELFYLEFSQEGEELSSIFSTRNLREKVQGKNNQEVYEVIKKEVDDAIESSFQILRSRIDRFGVTQPNIRKTNVPGRIIVELPGVKDPERARKLLVSSAQLEFWETFEFSEIWDDIQTADIYLSERNGYDTLNATPDTVFDASRNPWIAVCTPPQYFIQNFDGTGPVVGITKDTATLNSYINDEDFMRNFDPDLKFALSPRTSNSIEQEFLVIALKRKGTDGYVMDGGVISDAIQTVDGNEVLVSMNMNADGANKWRNVTGKNKGRSIAIVLDGYVKSYPTVNEEIPNGRSQISGDFDINEGKDLANVLKSGKLPAKAEITREAIIGPSLGQDSIDSGLKSFMIALIFVFIYMIFYYYGGGLVSNIALITNIFFIFGVLSSLGAVLTLPGIAGIVLTIGMSVDANVLIYERIREELSNGKGLRLAINDGYKSAYSSIIDANVTTLLTGIILFSFGTGPIKGFATTLIIGIITSLFSAIFITRLIISYRLDKSKLISFSTRITDGAFKNLNIDFIGKRKIFYIFSSILIILGTYSLSTRGLNLGIDFEGGNTYIVNLEEEVSISEIRDLLESESDLGLSAINYNITDKSKLEFKTGSNYRISTKNTNVTDVDVVRILSEISKVNIEGNEAVKATIADDIRDSALWSIIFSLIIIFLYILVRFRRWQFSLGAVVAVFHDVLLVLSVFSILHGIMPFSLEIDQAFIAAILTIIGYSLNDTVVVFDRVREYMDNYKKKEVYEIINQSLNSTLSRTVNTSLTTLVVLLVIFIFGGEAIKGFMFALMIGVLVGTYSSIFVASPIMVDTIKRKKIK
tara:strand:+ start:14101 stop:17046 length:2946 start_codon:yes stop_codon:yes gene_type:complete